MSRAELTRWLADHTPRLGSLFSQINYMVNQAMPQGEWTHPTQTFREPVRGGLWRQAIERIQALELATLGEDNQTLTFTGPDQARYLRGGWLEEYAWLTARQLAPKDLGCSVQVEWDSEAPRPTTNEFDLLVVDRNRMLVVECKAGLFGNEQKGQDILHKLDSLGKQSGGQMGTRLLLSVRTLEESTRNRAKDMGIQLVEGKQLAQLDQIFRRWQEGKPHG